MKYYQKIPVYPGEMHFSLRSIFKESTLFDRQFTLPFNTLVGVFEDDNSEASQIVNNLTGEKWHRLKNYLYFTPANLPVTYISRPNLHYIAIFFNLEPYPGRDLFDGQNQWIIEYSPEMVAELQDIYRYADRLQSLVHCQEFCLRFCLKHWPGQANSNFAELRKFEKVLHHIRNHGHAGTKVRELATLMHMSGETFSKEFTRTMAKTPKEFLQAELTNKASALLINPEMNIKEVAAILNFTSEFYFSKFFKRQVGISPSEYKKNFSRS